MNLNNENQPKGGEQAEAQQFAIRSLATIRESVINSLLQLEASPTPITSPILPKSRKAGTLAQAHSSVQAYHRELAKSDLLDETDGWEYYREQFTTTPVPKPLSEGHAVVDVPVDDMANGTVEDYLHLVKHEPVEISLADVPDWRQRSFNIRKIPSSPYESYRDPETVSRKLVLPPKTLDDVFTRLDGLASHYGVLIQIQNSGEEIDADYSDVVDVGIDINS